MTCSRCHDRGVLDGGGYCSCFTGRNAQELDVIRSRLSKIWNQRDVDFWLRKRNVAMGSERPLDLVRQGRASEVLTAIERLPGLVSEGEVEVTPQPPQIQTATLERRPEDPKLIRRALATQMRRNGEYRIARALELGSVEVLSDREQALIDAALTGQGYLVDGKRIDPLTVEIVRWVS